MFATTHCTGMLGKTVAHPLPAAGMRSKLMSSLNVHPCGPTAMTNNPFQEPPKTNPYASPAPQAGYGPSNNPLLVPAIVLLIFSSLFVLLIVATLPGQIIRIRAIDVSTPGGVGEFLGSIATLTVWPLLNLAIALGAISMIRLTSYRSSYSAAILSVIPVCSPCFVLGIPFGIWAIVVLNRPTVKQRFLKN